MRGLIWGLFVVPVFVVGCGGTGGSSSGGIPVTTQTVAAHSERYTVPSASMEPTLHCARPGAGCGAQVADQVLVREPVTRVRRGDVLVFRTPYLAMVRCGAGGLFIKRVIALPGDRWAEQDGFVYVNDKKLNERYVSADRRDARTITPITIPVDHYFVMGDNRSASCDSRAWGSVPFRNLVGTVVRIIRWKVK